MFTKRTSGSTIAAACLLLAGVVPGARATVLSSSATPNGYSLSTLAVDTAVYNTGAATGNPATPAAPNIPFKVLEGNTFVYPGTYIYVPIFYADNSVPVDPNFPASITNQATDASYLDALVLSEANVTAFFVDVDGQNTTLDDSYIVGVNTPTLLDGTPGGNDYILSAAVIAPLSPGVHTVGYGGVIKGTDSILALYTVNVPEPASVGLLSMLAMGLMGRRRNRC